MIVPFILFWVAFIVIVSYSKNRIQYIPYVLFLFLGLKDRRVTVTTVEVIISIVIIIYVVLYIICRNNDKRIEKFLRSQIKEMKGEEWSSGLRWFVF